MLQTTVPETLLPETLQGAIDVELEALASAARGPLQEVIRYAVQGGKRLRGCLLLAVGESQPVSSGRLLSAAAAVELLHAATLVQDDIFDRSRTRRGRPATHCAFDARLATLASDWMLAESLRVGYRLASPLGESLAACAQQMIAGEAEELAGCPATSFGSRRAHALSIASAKTGELFGVAGSAGALLSGDVLQAACLHDLSRDLGLAFQYLDDALDLYGDEAAAGKDLARDLGARLSTLPVFDALVFLAKDLAQDLSRDLAQDSLSAMLEWRTAPMARALAQPRVRQHLLWCAQDRWSSAVGGLLRALPKPGTAETLLRSYAPALSWSESPACEEPAAASPARPAA